MAVIFVNRFFYPDHSATAQLLSDLAFALAEDGRDVVVLTSRLGYDASDGPLPPREVVDQVRVERLWTTRFGRHALVGRALDYLTFYLSAMLAVARLVRRRDVVVVMTDPPMLAVPLGWIVRARRARLVAWLQDIFPEIALALGLGPMWLMPGLWLQKLRDRSLMRADRVVVLGEEMAERVRGMGVQDERLKLIPNWADDRALRPIPPAENPLRQAWGLEGRVVIGYSGNLGRAHDVETLLAAADLLRHRDDLVFLFIGGGHHRAVLNVRAAGDARFVFQPYQERSRLAESLSAIDIHWTSLRPELEGLIVPSKVYGIMAVGRPIVHVGDPEGEVGRIVRRQGCGRVVSQGDAARLAQVLAELADNTALRQELGTRARAMVDEDGSFAVSFRGWRALLDEPVEPVGSDRQGQGT